MFKNYKIGFIGAGTMGKAIIGGLINSGFILKDEIIASEISQNAAEKVSSKIGIVTTLDNNELVEKSDIIVLCVKPHIVKTILESVKKSLSSDKLLISIAAGVSTSFIEEILDKQVPVIRIMPNTPALVGEGMSVICKGKYTSEKQMEYAGELFSKVGRCLEIDEKYINAVTGISGSGPAFMYLIIEALADGGVKLGLPKQKAIELAAQTALGAAKMVIETGKHPSVLKDEVTTPGGTTIAGLIVMEDNKIRAALAHTVEAAAKRAEDLAG